MIASAGYKTPSKDYIDISLSENDEKVRILGIRQKRNPFQIPLSFELISLSFYKLTIPVPILIKIVNIKKASARINSPERL
jgi:hypothetical protein